MILTSFLFSSDGVFTIIISKLYTGSCDRRVCDMNFYHMPCKVLRKTNNLQVANAF